MPGAGVVVRERQEVVLVEGVVHPEDELGVAFRPLGWLQGHVLLERVVDPAEVPLVVEAESAASCRPSSDVGPRRRVLGERQHPGVVLVDLLVHPLQERDGGEVLVAAELVGLPRSRLALEVEPDHRFHPVDPQAVEMILLEPE